MYLGLAGDVKAFVNSTFSTFAFSLPIVPLSSKVALLTFAPVKVAPERYSLSMGKDREVTPSGAPRRIVEDDASCPLTTGSPDFCTFRRIVFVTTAPNASVTDIFTVFLPL